MKTITQSNPVQLSTSVSGYGKLNNHLIQPMIAGFLGFSVILVLIFFIDLLSYNIGLNEKSKFDFLDLYLAGIGFVLRFTEVLLRSIFG